MLTRVDFNVPQADDGTITDDRRIRLALPTIESIVSRSGRAILMSHLGRPSGKRFEPAYTMAPVAERLAELMPGERVRFLEGPCDQQAGAVASLRDREVAVLENLRFCPGEKDGDAAFAARLAAWGDFYCNEAFGTAHRADASMVAVPMAMAGRPRVAGLLLARELRYLSEAIAEARRVGVGFVAVLGGAKVSDKLQALANLIGTVNTILVGGAMAYTFLAARGAEVGSSLTEPALRDDARRILEDAASGSTEIVLPADHVCGRARAAGTPVTVHRGSIPAGWMGLDIGPATVTRYAAALRPARTVVWNGPMGAFEVPPFEAGTRRIAEAMIEATERGATTIVGGGDTAAAVEGFGLADRFSHVSTGGGASLQMLEGKRFESVELLDPA